MSSHTILRAQVRKSVALMRELGVARITTGVLVCDSRGESVVLPLDIYLGPPPAPEVKPRTVDEEIAYRAREAERKHETLFAATSIRPVLPQTEAGQRASVLKSVVPRGNAQEHDNGPQTGT